MSKYVTGQFTHGEFAHKYCFIVEIYGLTVKKYDTLSEENFNYENMLDKVRLV